MCIFFNIFIGRIDADLFVTIQNLLHQYNELLSTSQSSDSTSANAIEFPAVAILQALQATALALPADKRVAFNNQSSALWCVFRSRSNLIVSHCSNYAFM